MGKVAEIKTKQTSESVEGFLSGINDEQKRNDCLTIIKMMEKLTKENPMMWGKSMIGFGKIRYKSPATGREVDWFRIGFAPRKSNLSLHLIYLPKGSKMMETLGKYKTGGGCLYINKLADVDTKVLEKIMAASLES